MTPKEKFYNTLGIEMIKKLERRGFEAHYAADEEDALDIVKKILPVGVQVSWGGTTTLAETGIKDYLRSGVFDVIDRSDAKSAEEKEEFCIKALTCDYYFMSSNAITRDGVLVNIDGNGNRLAALIYGPDNVVVIAGMNKVVVDESEAVSRIQNIAAPMNAHRLGRQTPCQKTGSCGDCLSPDSMCSHTVFTRRSFPQGRIKVILLGKELGY